MVAHSCKNDLFCRIVWFDFITSNTRDSKEQERGARVVEQKRHSTRRTNDNWIILNDVFLSSNSIWNVSREAQEWANDKTRILLIAMHTYNIHSFNIPYIHSFHSIAACLFVVKTWKKRENFIIICRVESESTIVEGMNECSVSWKLIQHFHCHFPWQWQKKKHSLWKDMKWQHFLYLFPIFYCFSWSFHSFSLCWTSEETVSCLVKLHSWTLLCVNFPFPFRPLFRFEWHFEWILTFFNIT